MVSGVGHSPVATSSDILVERIAGRIARWKLATPALLFLEANKPLSFIGSQALLMAQPVADFIVPSELVSDLYALLADRSRVEQLIDRLQDVAMGADQTRQDQ